VSGDIILIFWRLPRRDKVPNSVGILPVSELLAIEMTSNQPKNKRRAPAQGCKKTHNLIELYLLETRPTQNVAQTYEEAYSPFRMGVRL
jgi:hypothetical protein